MKKLTNTIKFEGEIKCGSDFQYYVATCMVEATFAALREAHTKRHKKNKFDYITSYG